MRSANGKGQSGFTMVEIAIAIAVIGFALVAIVGVLPTGMQVQRDNREDTIINHDGTYWMEAIRSGATGSVDLLPFVEQVTDKNGVTNKPPASSMQVLSFLSDCIGGTGSDLPHATIRAISGPAIDRDSQATDMAFRYVLYSQVSPLVHGNTNTVITVNTNAFDIRLIFQWPVLANGTVGSGRKVFRTIVSGHMIQTNGYSVLEPNQFGP